jgi:hypothetical protein
MISIMIPCSISYAIWIHYQHTPILNLSNLHTTSTTILGLVNGHNAQLSNLNQQVKLY